jgi:predicted DNA-binding protein YlxM (UPF0122 family)
VLDLERILYNALLYDYYGALLTEKQRLIFEMYNHEDMSLTEISEVAGVSPQGISDMLKRTEKLLLNYEEKTGLIALRERDKQSLKDIKDKLNALTKNDIKNENIKDLIYIIDSVIENF